MDFTGNGNFSASGKHSEQLVDSKTTDAQLEIPEVPAKGRISGNV